VGLGIISSIAQGSARESREIKILTNHDESTRLAQKSRGTIRRLVYGPV
jgi:phage head maturation protease